MKVLAKQIDFVLETFEKRKAPSVMEPTAGGVV